MIFGSTVGIKLTYLVRSKKLNDEYRKVIYKQLSRVKNNQMLSESSINGNMKDIAQFNINYSESLITEHNEIDIITNGKEKYEKLIDDEVCAFIYDEDFAKKHENVFEIDKKNSIELNYEAFKTRSLWRKIKERFYRLFAPLM